MKKHLISAVLALCALVPAANAFKLETHLWVGQQVINDIEDDGQLSFKLGDKEVKIFVDDYVKDAILNNKQHYLMGNIGPDAAPDVVVGQNVIHPGIRDETGHLIGWDTSSWLTYLLQAGDDYKTETGSDIGIAYSYGFLGHASADVFAHTYVNQYAGDVFSITDNEILVEKRHMALEGYIAKHNPPFKDHTGKDLGAPYGLITLGDDYANFIREKMIYNEEIQDEYWKTSTALHLAGYYDLRKSIDDLANDAVWTEIDKAVAKMIAAYFSVELSDDEAGLVVGKIDILTKSVSDGIDDIQSAADGVYEVFNKYDDAVFKNLSNGVNSLKSVENNLVSLHSDLTDQIGNLLNIENCPNTIWLPPHCNLGGCSGGRWKKDPSCLLAVEANKKSNELVNAAIKGIQSEISNKNDDLIAKAGELQQEAQKTINSVHAVVNAVVDVAQIPGYGSSPIKSILLNWLNDIDIAMLEYVKATSQAMLNTMDHDQSSTEPVVEWFGQYNLSILGVPKTGTDAINTVAELKDNIESVIMVIDEAASIGTNIPGASKLIALKNEAIDELTEGLKEQGTDKLTTFLPDAWQDLLALTESEMNATTLNTYFSKPETEENMKGLIMIPDMAARVDAEMKLDSNGAYDPNIYPLVYNAIVMAKLALLSKHDFVALAEASGSVVPVEDEIKLQNVVAQAIGDIDGNHQWMPIPPPLPNNLDKEYETPLHGYSTEDGFLPWKGDMRDKLFRKLFKGPLSAGIDAPEAIGKSKLVNNNYPYEVCSANPYPDDVNDRLCTVVVLIPIITSLLH